MIKATRWNDAILQLYARQLLIYREESKKTVKVVTERNERQTEEETPTSERTGREQPAERLGPATEKPAPYFHSSLWRPRRGRAALPPTG